jgi:hypothetical protein
MYYTGIDLHKFTSYLTTVNPSGVIVKQENLRNVAYNFVQYFASLPGEHKTTVESTMTWYWLNDLLSSINIPLVLAHAKYVKAIAYAKVKTDKVDSHTLAQLLRMDYIPVAHKISNDNRLCNVIPLLLILCSFCLPSITLILQPNLPVFPNSSMNNSQKLRLYLMSKCLISRNNFILSLFLTMTFNVCSGFPE